MYANSVLTTLIVGAQIDIEAQIKAQQAQREEILREQQESKRAALVGKIAYDQELYGTGDRFAGEERASTGGGGGGLDDEHEV